jgi:hypothetical protein
LIGDQAKITKHRAQRLAALDAIEKPLAHLGKEWLCALRRKPALAAAFWA